MKKRKENVFSYFIEIRTHNFDVYCIYFTWFLQDVFESRVIEWSAYLLPLTAENKTRPLPPPPPPPPSLNPPTADDVIVSCIESRLKSKSVFSE